MVNRSFLIRRLKVKKIRILYYKLWEEQQQYFINIGDNNKIGLLRHPRQGAVLAVVCGFVYLNDRPS